MCQSRGSGAARTALDPAAEVAETQRSHRIDRTAAQTLGPGLRHPRKPQKRSAYVALESPDGNADCGVNILC